MDEPINLLRALLAIIQRELTRMFRQRGRLLSAMVRPLIWLLVIGTGFEALLGEAALTEDRGTDYRRSLVPGLVCMVLLFGAMLASLSMVYDKESGVMRMLIIAPFPRYMIVLARLISAVMAALVQATMLLLILALLGYFTALAHPLWLAAALVMTASVCAVAGMLIAVHCRTLENFAVIMNFVIFPMFFLSGALYPVQHLPQVMKLVVWVNPFSYGVDLMKHAFLAGTQGAGNFVPDLPVWLDLSVLLAFIVVATIAACLRFSQVPVMERLSQGLSAGRRS